MTVRLAATMRRYGGETQLTNARAAWSQRSGLVLTLRGGGAVGQGEAAPLPGYSRETLEACAAALQAVRWDALRAPGAPDEVAGVVEAALAAAALAPAAARCALEAALWDWLGRRTGLPVWGLLGGAHAELPLSGLWAAGSSVAELRRRGVRVVKVKVGRAGDWAGELALLRALRDADLVPRVDANCAWPVALAAQRLAELRALAPELVEEPLEGGLLAAAGVDAAGLARGGLRLAADESLAGAALAQLDAALAAGWLGALVLKPMLLGGIGPCVALARRALAAGAHIVVTHTWDGPIGLATAAALALALTSTSTSTGRVLAAGLSRHPGLAAWPALALPMLRDDRIVTLDTPGLGLAELPS